MFSNHKLSDLLMTPKIPQADASVWLYSVVLKGYTYRAEKQKALKHRIEDIILPR